MRLTASRCRAVEPNPPSQSASLRQRFKIGSLEARRQRDTSSASGTRRRKQAECLDQGTVTLLRGHSPCGNDHRKPPPLAGSKSMSGNTAPGPRGTRLMECGRCVMVPLRRPSSASPPRRRSQLPDQAVATETRSRDAPAGRDAGQAEQPGDEDRRVPAQWLSWRGAGSPRGAEPAKLSHAGKDAEQGAGVIGRRPRHLGHRRPRCGHGIRERRAAPGDEVLPEFGAPRQRLHQQADLSLTSPPLPAAAEVDRDRAPLIPPLPFGAGSGARPG